MNKLKKPCKCGHRSGKHSFIKKWVAPNFFSAFFFAKNFKLAGHNGKCHQCDCKSFKETE